MVTGSTVATESVIIVPNDTERKMAGGKEGETLEFEKHRVRFRYGIGSLHGRRVRGSRNASKCRVFANVVQLCGVAIIASSFDLSSRTFEPSSHEMYFISGFH